MIESKPPKSPTLSPKRNDRARTSNGSCNKILFANNSNDSSSTNTTKHSPTRTGIMSSLAKNPHRIKSNNVLLNALSMNQTRSSVESVHTNQAEVITLDYSLIRMTTIIYGKAYAEMSKTWKQKPILREDFSDSYWN